MPCGRSLLPVTPVGSGTVASSRPSLSQVTSWVETNGNPSSDQRVCPAPWGRDRKELHSWGAPKPSFVSSCSSIFRSSEVDQSSSYSLATESLTCHRRSPAALVIAKRNFTMSA
ncbi:Multidrug resistance protein 1 [Platysternon megacephalum]|uniref:Multidrug resistance protein 1 n=1 Tax=Platysternon megacephalum TaxID=55544 RepID=A0A4D9DJG7_9SAUR|nr:Multidrug resistance protein 1 [Platysternon megacephalum]